LSGTSPVGLQNRGRCVGRKESEPQEGGRLARAVKKSRRGRAVSSEAYGRVEKNQKKCSGTWSCQAKDLGPAGLRKLSPVHGQESQGGPGITKPDVLGQAGQELVLGLGGSWAGGGGTQNEGCEPVPKETARGTALPPSERGQKPEQGGKTTWTNRTQGGSCPGAKKRVKDVAAGGREWQSHPADGGGKHGRRPGANVKKQREIDAGGWAGDRGRRGGPIPGRSGPRGWGRGGAAKKVEALTRLKRQQEGGEWG